MAETILSALVFDTGPEAAALRLDHFLAAQMPEWSRAKLQALVRAGGVRVNGKVAERPGALVGPASQVEVRPQPAPRSALEPEAIPLEVLYEDDDLVAVNKPAGLMVHPGAGERQTTLVNALLYRYQTLSRHGGESRPGIVHRLDRFTSGVMVVARNDWTHQRLAEQFQTRTVQKTYMALVHGGMAAERGEIDSPIHRDLHHRVRMTTRRRGGREAHTSYRVVEAFEPPTDTAPNLRAVSRYSWLEVKIHTGRTHQIRVHLSALGHPVVGDRLYGAATTLAGPPAVAGLQPERVMLHAAELRIEHPRTGEALTLAAPLPEAILGMLARLRPAQGQAGASYNPG